MLIVQTDPPKKAPPKKTVARAAAWRAIESCGQSRAALVLRHGDQTWAPQASCKSALCGLCAGVYRAKSLGTVAHFSTKVHAPFAYLITCTAPPLLTHREARAFRDDVLEWVTGLVADGLRGVAWVAEATPGRDGRALALCGCVMPVRGESALMADTRKANRSWTGELLIGPIRQIPTAKEVKAWEDPTLWTFGGVSDCWRCFGRGVAPAPHLHLHMVVTSDQRFWFGSSEGPNGEPPVAASLRALGYRVNFQPVKKGVGGAVSYISKGVAYIAKGTKGKEPTLQERAAYAHGMALLCGQTMGKGGEFDGLAYRFVRPEVVVTPANVKETAKHPIKPARPDDIKGRGLLIVRSGSPADRSLRAVQGLMLLNGDSAGASGEAPQSAGEPMPGWDDTPPDFCPEGSAERLERSRGRPRVGLGKAWGGRDPQAPTGDLGDEVCRNCFALCFRGRRCADCGYRPVVFLGEQGWESMEATQQPRTRSAGARASDYTGLWSVDYFCAGLGPFLGVLRPGRAPRWFRIH